MKIGYEIYNSNFSKEDSIKMGNYLKDNKEEENLSIKILNSMPEEVSLSDDGKIKLNIMGGG